MSSRRVEGSPISNYSLEPNLEGIGVNARAHRPNIDMPHSSGIKQPSIFSGFCSKAARYHVALEESGFAPIPTRVEYLNIVLEIAIRHIQATDELKKLTPELDKLTLVKNMPKIGIEITKGQLVGKELELGAKEYDLARRIVRTNDSLPLDLRDEHPHETDIVEKYRKRTIPRLIKKIIFSRSNKIAE